MFFNALLLLLSVVFSSYVLKYDEPEFKQVTGESCLPDEKIVIRYDADEVLINSETSEIVTDERLSNGKGITLKSGVNAAIDGEREQADMVFYIKVPDKDFCEKYGEELISQMTLEKKITQEQLFIDKYMDEFETNGLNNLIIKE